jgi:hypothetical protein
MDATFAFLNEYRQVIGFGVVALYLCRGFLPNVPAFFARLRSMSPAMPGVTVPAPVVDPLPVIKQLNKRFKGNVQAEAALKVIWSCLLEDEAS